MTANGNDKGIMPVLTIKLRQNLKIGKDGEPVAE